MVFLAGKITPLSEWTRVTIWCLWVMAPSGPSVEGSLMHGSTGMKLESPLWVLMLVLLSLLTGTGWMMLGGV